MNVHTSATLRFKNINRDGTWSRAFHDGTVFLSMRRIPHSRKPRTLPRAFEEAARHILSATNDAPRTSYVGANSAELIVAPFAA